MRSLFFILAFCLIWIPFTRAQQFKAGLTAGASTSQIAGDGFTGFNKFGIIGGGFVNTQISKKGLIGQFELIYIEKGSRDPSKPSKGKYTEKKFDLAYIATPFVIKYPHDKFVFEGGISYGRLIRHREFDQNGELHENLKSDFKNYEVAGIVGINYRLNEKFTSNVRYVRSLAPVRDKAVIIPGLGIWGGSYSTAITFSLFYHLIGENKDEAS